MVAILALPFAYRDRCCGKIQAQKVTFRSTIAKSITLNQPNVAIVCVLEVKWLGYRAMTLEEEWP